METVPLSLEREWELNPEKEPVCPLCGSKAREGEGEPFFGVVVRFATKKGDVFVHGICLNRNVEVVDGKETRVA